MWLIERCVAANWLSPPKSITAPCVYVCDHQFKYDIAGSSRASNSVSTEALVIGKASLEVDEDEHWMWVARLPRHSAFGGGGCVFAL